MEDEINLKVGERVGAYTVLQSPLVTPPELDDIAEPLGRGGMAKVYLVKQKMGEGVEIKRALKIHSPEEKIRRRRSEADQSVGRNSFLDEIQAISSFTHQNLVKIIDAGDHSYGTGLTAPYFVMEYVEGADLRTITTPGNPQYDKWKKRASEDPFLIIKMAQQICWPINYLHSQEFFHFDIAPKNIFIRDNNSRPHLLVGDLGVGRRVPNLPNDPTKKVFISGTRDYSPKEIHQHLNAEIEIGELSQYASYWDVYAIAKVTEKLIEAYDLGSNSELDTARLLCERMKDIKQSYTTQKVSSELDRLLPAHVLTAGVEELSSDAAGKRHYLNIPLYPAPLSKRIKSVIDHPTFARLQLAPQLLLVRTALPGGVHTMYEHSLGSYALMIRCLTKMLSRPKFRLFFAKKEIEEALLAVLLFKLASFPLDRVFLSVVNASKGRLEKKELFEIFFDYVHEDIESLRTTIQKSFPDVEIESVINILFSPIEQLQPYQKVISSMLRSSIDVRVIDYLARDSHHTGIPAGIGIDVGNIIENLTWTNGNEGIGITEAGVFAVEHLLCARYWMFSRVYWSPQNRAIATMLRHCIYFMVKGDLNPRHFIRELMKVDEKGALVLLSRSWETTASKEADTSIIELLQNPQPRLYQSVLELDSKNWSSSKMKKCESSIYGKGLNAPEQLEGLGSRFEDYFNNQNSSNPLSRGEVLFDLTNEHPLKLGEDIWVHLDSDQECELSSTSEIVRALPNAFSNSATRLRVFCHPKLIDDKARAQEIASSARIFLDSEFQDNVERLTI